MIQFHDYFSFKYYLRYLFFLGIPKCFYELVLKYKYKKEKLGNLNLNFPEKLSEKIQWIKLYGITEEKKYLTDKIKVKRYINKIIPELKCANIYQIATSFKELDFNKLPERFVLKTNHAWATNIIVYDKNELEVSDYKKLEKFFNKVLKINYAYWSYYELQYKDIKPKIYAEELLGNNYNVADYEIWCFNGSPEFISYRYAVNRNGHKIFEQCFFNTNWEVIDFYVDYANGTPEKLSKNKEYILEYAQRLSANIDFVRIDFMEIENEFYFCEMTFTPCSGFFNIKPKNKDTILGLKLYPYFNINK